MPIETNIDQIIEYKARAIKLIGSTQEVVALLLNDPDIDVSSEAAEVVYEKNIFDRTYNDITVLEGAAVVLLECAIIQHPTDTIKRLALYVQVVCDRNYMDLSPQVFTGVRGNRRDNIARQIDLVLSDNQDFGIGELRLESCEPITTPLGFSGVVLTYTSPDFD